MVCLRNSRRGRVRSTCLLAVWLCGQALFAAEPASLAPPRHVGPPLPEHAATNRAFQGIPSLAVASGGR
ncbi:MAG: hypothetical protein EBX36_09625, partial [Planctomycetia bacterium]|nr:hypothetical protein [Planctomycetia bacterium]